MEGYKLRVYTTEDGVSPYWVWLESLPKVIRARIQARVARFESGNLGDIKSVGDQVMEARMHFGSGYRLYFAQEGACVVILLCGGDKRSQRKDIVRAKALWGNYLERGS